MFPQEQTSGERMIVRSINDEPTHPGGDHTMLVYQKTLLALDAMNEGDRIKFLCLAEAWLQMTKENRDVVLDVSETLAGL